jgi:ferredoxin
MAFVVTEACVNCKYGDCVEVCPVECFYQAEDMLYIHPDECIDCTACQPVCPVAAIFPADECTQEWIDRNASFPWAPEFKVTKKDQVVHGPQWDAAKAG